MIIDRLAALDYVELPMKDTLTITQGQAQFPALCRKAKTTAITRNGEVVSFVVPRRKMAGLLEQMEILANPRAMAAIHKARTGKGKYHPLNVLDEK
jgi:hypothetical protein